MKKKTKIDIASMIIGILVVIGLASLITVIWQGLEILFYNEIQYRKVDDIISTILLISLLFNLKYAVEKLDSEEENER